MNQVTVSLSGKLADDGLNIRYKSGLENRPLFQIQSTVLIVFFIISRLDFSQQLQLRAFS